MGNVENSDFFGTRTLNERSKDEIRVSSQAAVLRELLIEEEVMRIIYLTTPLGDENARGRALEQLQETEALRRMAELVVGSDMRYTQEPDPLTIEGMSYIMRSFNPDVPAVLIRCEMTRLPPGSRADWQRTYEVSLGSKSLEGEDAQVFAHRALTVLERVKGEMTRRQESNRPHIPAPPTG